MNYLCPYCKELIDVAPEFIGQRVECPHCSEEFTVAKTQFEKKPAVVAPVKFRYTTIIIHFNSKNFVFLKEDLLQGLSDESAEQFTRLGNEGWELVSVLPFGSGKSGFLSTAEKDSAIAFFKRSA